MTAVALSPGPAGIAHPGLVLPSSEIVSLPGRAVWPVAPHPPRRATAGVWTPERAIAAMQTWNQRFQRPPRSYEWAPATGRAAGLLPSGMTLWELEHPRWPSTGTVAARFGTWCDGLRAAGLPARIPHHDLPPRERMLAARRLARTGMSPRAIADLLGIGAGTVSGYLRGATCPACAGPLVCGSTCSACAPRTAPNASRDEVARALHDWVAAHGRPPTQHDWGREAGPTSPWVTDWPRWPSASTVRTHFGTWNEALRQAGLPIGRRSEWTDDDIVDAIQRWAREHGGEPPRCADLARATDRACWPDPRTAANHFGSWRAALDAAGFRSRRAAPAARAPA